MRLPGRRPKLWRGYRNCDVCSRWRPVSDYPVYKSRSGYEQIKGICESCKNKKERERYESLTPEQKRAKGKEANRHQRKRRVDALHEIERLRSILDEQNEKLDKQYARLEKARSRVLHWENGEAYLDIVPFRMWLLRQHRESGYDLKQLAEQVGYDDSQISRWMQGFHWNGVGRDPAAIRSIKLSIVDEIATRLEDPGLMDRLYPVVDPD